MPDPGEAVVAYTEAFGLGDIEQVLATISERCQDIVPEAAFSGSVDYYAVLNPELTAYDVTSTIDGNRAAVSYLITDPEAPPYDGQPWLFENDAWRWDAC